MPTNTSFKNGRFLLAAALLLGFFVNLNVLQNDFGWDDDEIVPHLNRVESWAQIFFPSGGGDASGKAMVYYRPLIKASYYLDYRIWGEKPFGFHFSVLFFHLLNTVLVFSLARTLAQGTRGPPKEKGRAYPGKETGFPGGADSSQWVGFLAAVFFSIHPIHSEAVAWIAGRNDVLCTMFMLGAFLAYIRFQRERGKIGLSLSLGLFFFALITKETAVFLPGVFLLYEAVMWTRGKGSLARVLLLRATPLALVEGLYFGIRSIASHTLASGPGRSIDVLSASMVGKGLTALGLYFKMLVFPYPHQPFIESLRPSLGYMVFAVIVLVVLAFLMIRGMTPEKAIVVVGLGWTLCLMFPGVLVSVIPVAVTDAAERYLYPASVGWVIVVSHWVIQGAGKLSGSRPFPKTPVGKAVIFSVCFIVVVGSLERWKRNAVWLDQITFWEAATRLNPESGLPLLELGTEYAKAGQLQKAEDWLVRAASNFEHGRGPYNRGLSKTFNNLGELYRIQGRVAEAEEAHLKTLRIRQAVWGPGHPEVGKTYFNLGLIKQSQGKFPEAEGYYKKALSTWENSRVRAGGELTKTLNNLAAVVGSQGRHEEAAKLFGRALAVLVRQFGPSHPELVNAMENYALALRRSGKGPEAQQMEDQARFIRGF